MTLPRDSAAPLEFVLRPGVLTTVDWTVPSPREAFRRSDAVAHVRILRTAAPGNCAFLDAVTMQHEAEAVHVITGELPRKFQLAQVGAGTCWEDLKALNGIERSYEPGDEFIVFLERSSAGFTRLAGPALTFPLRGDRVQTRGFMGLAVEIAHAEFESELVAAAATAR